MSVPDLAPDDDDDDVKSFHQGSYRSQEKKFHSFSIVFP